MARSASGSTGSVDKARPAGLTAAQLRQVRKEIGGEYSAAVDALGERLATEIRALGLAPMPQSPSALSTWNVTTVDGADDGPRDGGGRPSLGSHLETLGKEIAGLHEQLRMLEQRLDPILATEDDESTPVAIVGLTHTSADGLDTVAELVERVGYLQRLVAGLFDRALV